MPWHVLASAQSHSARPAMQAAAAASERPRASPAGLGPVHCAPHDVGTREAQPGKPAPAAHSITVKT